MKRGGLLSVVLATFNGGRHLSAQLASLAAQTEPPDELLVCDDGSADDTLDRVNAFALTAPFPVRLQRNPVRLGYADNFLRGASLCTGAWIAFCDQDDVWQPEKLRRCREALTRSGALLVVHNAAVVDAELRPLGRAKPDFPCTATLPRRGCELALTLPGFAMVFAASLLRGQDTEQRPVDGMQAGAPRFAHDQWVAFLARSAGPTVHLAETLAQYRQHNANTCGAVAPLGARPPAQGRAADCALYRRRAAASAAHAAALTECALRTGSPHAPQWLASAAEYRSQAARHEARACVYDDTRTRRSQATRFLHLLGTGGYRPQRASGLGWRACGKDAASLLRRLA